MPLLESAAEHRPTFFVTGAGEVMELSLSPEQEFGHYAKRPLFAGILDSRRPLPCQGFLDQRLMGPVDGG